MTDTEKILNLLESNEKIPALVTDEENKIISSNQAWVDNFGQIEIDQSFNKLFDKNTSLLIKSSFIDAKAFLRIQRRDVQFVANGILKDCKLLLSPFKLDSKIYIYILLYNSSLPEELLVYPTLDENSIPIRYGEIITQIKESLPTTLIEKKNLQFDIDSKKDPIAIKDKYQFLFTNSSFNSNFNIKDGATKLLSSEEVFASNFLSKIQLAENELFLTKSSFVVEKKDYTKSTIYHGDRILLYPIQKSNGQVESIMIIGSIEVKESDTIDQVIEIGRKGQKTIDNVNDKIILEESELAKIIYDKNDFDILDANLAASELYGYELETLKQLNITQLFSPEDMQKLLMSEDDTDKYILKQLKSDGSTFEVNLEREYISWQGKDSCIATIMLNQPEEEEIKLDEFRKRRDLQKNQI